MSKMQLHFFGPINVSTIESFRNMLLNAMRTPNVDELEILMSSEGGDLNSGFTAYSYLRSVPMKTTIINMGAIESIALMPFLGGTERKAVPNARFLIHNFTWTFPNTPTDINRVTERSNSLLADVERYTKIYTERTSGAEKPIDVKSYLTGPAAVIGPEGAFRAGILTSSEFSFPALSPASIYDQLFK